MSATATLTLDLALKQGVLSNVVTLREVVSLTLVGAEVSGYADLRLSIIDNGVVVATVNSFNSSYVGSLNLNTVELVDSFEYRGKTASKQFSWQLQDITTVSVLLNDRLPIQNNPFEPGMLDPTPVDPPSVGDYALVANGVKNGSSHDHTSGAGGTVAHASLSGAGANSHATIDILMTRASLGKHTANNDVLRIDMMALKDDTDGKFYRIFWSDGVLARGAEVGDNT